MNAVQTPWEHQHRDATYYIDPKTSITTLIIALTYIELCLFKTDVNTLYKGWLDTHWSKIAVIFICDCLLFSSCFLFSHYNSCPDVSSGHNPHSYVRSKIQRKKLQTELLGEKYWCTCKNTFLPWYRIRLSLGKGVIWRVSQTGEKRSGRSQSCRELTHKGIVF